MDSYLRKATASQSRATPAFIDSTDGKTPKTGLTIANTDVKLVLNGGASADKNSGGGTHRVNGVYGLTFDATDSANVGELLVSIVVATALPVYMKFQVLEAAVYDAMFAASAPGYTDDELAFWQLGLRTDAAIKTDRAAARTKLNADQGTGAGDFDPTVNGTANVTQIGGDSQSATDLKDFVDTGYDPSTHLAGVDVTRIATSATAATNAKNFWTGCIVDTGTAAAGAGSTVTLRSGASATNDYYKDAVVNITGGTGAGQCRQITGYVGSSKVATVDSAWATNPDNTSTYQILGRII